MAVQPVVMIVIGHRQVAVRALLDIAAVPAEDVGIAAAPVEEEHGLFLAFQHGVEGIAQRPAEHACIARLEFAAHIDHLDRRQVDGQRILGPRRIIARQHTFPLGLLQDARPVPHDALRQFQQLNIAALRPEIAGDIRRGAAQDQHTVVEAHHLFGHVAHMIVRMRRSRALLVAGVVLLVRHDQAQVREGCEQRRACPDHHADKSIARAPPGIVALALAEAAVHDGYLPWKPRRHPPDRLRRQGDLRHQKERLPPLRQRQFNRPQVDFRLAAARDAVQQEDRAAICFLHHRRGRL